MQMSVSNNVISEYVGSHIMQTLGLETQNTLLGYWGDEVVVACQDFRGEGDELHEFSWYMQNVIPKSQIGRIPAYEQLYKVLNECISFKGNSLTGEVEKTEKLSETDFVSLCKCKYTDTYERIFARTMEEIKEMYKTKDKSREEVQKAVAVP